MARISLVRRIEEPQFAKIIAKELNKQRKAVLAEVKKDLPQMDELFWEEHRESMTAAIIPTLVGIYDRAVGTTLGNTPMKQEPIGDLASRAVRWARQYAGELTRGITRTTQRVVRDSVATFISTPGMTTGDLTDMLSTTFGAARAQTIAVTEFTRAHFEGTREAADEARRVGFQMVGIWLTAADELVCPICAPLEGVKETSGTWIHPDGEAYRPPAHPNCRCDIAYELI